LPVAGSYTSHEAGGREEDRDMLGEHVSDLKLRVHLSQGY
jgi:hypothetical protein